MTIGIFYSSLPRSVRVVAGGGGGLVSKSCGGKQTSRAEWVMFSAWVLGVGGKGQRWAQHTDSCLAAQRCELEPTVGLYLGEGAYYP